jgi:hypothetical protein
MENLFDIFVIFVYIYFAFNLIKISYLLLNFKSFFLNLQVKYIIKQSNK